MKTIKTSVTELIEYISCKKHDDFEYLENEYTSPILSSDEYEKLPDEVQDAVELPTTSDILVIKR